MNWYEQNYCYDATNKMQDILQKVLTQFNNINAYKQDHRMVKVWLKYVSPDRPSVVPPLTTHLFLPAQVELQPNPLNIFQNLYQREIGTQLSFFYIAWANCYLKDNDFKLAESAINWGFQKQAKPLEELQSAQQQVANSYYEFTQRQRPGPYQIVIQQSPGNPHQPPLPAQVATNYQNPSYVRDKRKLEDTFPVHTVGAHQMAGGGGSVKRSRPNEAEYNGQYVPGGSYPNSNHYGQHAKVVYQNYAPAQHEPLQQHSPHQQQQHPPYVQQHPQMSGVGHENGKNHNNTHQYHQQQQPLQQGSVVYQQPQQQSYVPQSYQNGHGQTQTASQYHHQQQPPQVAYQTAYPASSISNSHQNPTVMSTTATTPGQQPPANNGYGDLHNSGYGIASSLNYVYEDYQQAGGEVVEEVVVEQPQDPATSNGLEAGIQVPENFARSATNSHNIWRAPLFLEEPYDPNRRPMYIKEQVYPVNGNEASGRCEYEYSFEELRKSTRLASRGTTSVPTVAEEGDPDTYVEYWTEEVTVQAEDYNSHGNVISGRVVSDSTYGEYVQEHHQGQENVYYHVMEPKERKSKTSSKKKKGKRKKMIVQINDASDEDEEDEEDDDTAADDEEYDAVAGGDEETTTIRYTCDQNGLSGAAQPGSGDVRRITIKLRKQITTPSSVATTPKVPFGNGQNGKSGSNGYGTAAIYKRTATDADADLLLSLGNGQSGYYQEMKPTAAYNDDSSSYSEYNASYNSSVYLGENSNSGPSTPMHSYQHHRHQMASVSATSTPQLTPAYRRLTKHRSNVSLMNDDSMSSTMNENSFFQGELDEEVKSRRLAKALATIEEHMAKDSIDPFNAEFCKALLTKIGFPSAELCDVYRMVQQPLPKLSNARQALLGDTYYNVRYLQAP